MSTAGAGVALGGGGGGGAKGDRSAGSASVSPPGTSGSRKVSIEPLYGVTDSRTVHPERAAYPRGAKRIACSSLLGLALLLSAHGRPVCRTGAGRFLHARPVACFDRDDRARSDEG